MRISDWSSDVCSSDLLVWLGRPANVASKLTDIANKSGEGMDLDILSVAYGRNICDEWKWYKEYPVNFVKNLEVNGGKITHKNPYYLRHVHTSEYYEERPATPPILMTAPVFNGFKAARPDEDTIKKGR